MRPAKQLISTPKITYPGVRMLISAYTTFEYTSRPNLPLNLLTIDGIKNYKRIGM